MAARKAGLGRGLDALLPVDRPSSGFTSLPLDRVVPNPQQPRSTFDPDAMASLAASIREVGVLQPVVVRPPSNEGEYVLVAGERRVRAARDAGLNEIPAVVRDDSDDVGNLTEALIENVQREDLSPLEEAAAFSQLMEDFGLTHEQIATRVAKSRSAVSNTLRLLQLPAAIQGMLERRELTAGHGRALLGIEDQTYAEHVARRAASEGWSVRQLEEAAKARTETAAPTERGPVALRPSAIIELEERLSERLGANVRIDYGGKHGKVVVRFGSLDELERLYRILAT